VHTQTQPTQRQRLDVDLDQAYSPNPCDERIQIQDELQDMGQQVNLKRIELLMRLGHLSSASRRRGYVVVTT
jgi:hypothetical protein